jgi:hypothetical protein
MHEIVNQVTNFIKLIIETITGKLNIRLLFKNKITGGTDG